MSYEKGRFAFFDGTSSEYKKVLQADETIAGYKIAEVGANHVTLQGNGKEVHLEVGGRMRKQQEGEWSVEGEKSDSTNSAPASASAPAGEVSDVLRRLMQKREQELQK